MNFHFKLSNTLVQDTHLYYTSDVKLLTNLFSAVIFNISTPIMTTQSL